MKLQTTKAPADGVAGFVPVGRIVGTFGLRGAVKVLPLTTFPERFDAGRTLFLRGVAREVRRSAWHKTLVRIWLEGISRVEEAATLVGELLYVPEEDLPPLEEGEYMVRDLIGLEVFDEAGRRLGVLEEVITAPAHDLYRVGAALIPAVKEFVRSIDIEARRMVIHTIPGMFSEDED
jgi:16S rRNA processing protein RimM